MSYLLPLKYFVHVDLKAETESKFLKKIRTFNSEKYKLQLLWHLFQYTVCCNLQCMFFTEKNKQISVQIVMTHFFLTWLYYRNMWEVLCAVNKQCGPTAGNSINKHTLSMKGQLKVHSMFTEQRTEQVRAHHMMNTRCNTTH